MLVLVIILQVSIELQVASAWIKTLRSWGFLWPARDLLFWVFFFFFYPRKLHRYLASKGLLLPQLADKNGGSSGPSGEAGYPIQGWEMPAAAAAAAAGLAAEVDATADATAGSAQSSESHAGCPVPTTPSCVRSHLLAFHIPTARWPLPTRAEDKA